MSRRLRAVAAMLALSVATAGCGNGGGSATNATTASPLSAETEAWWAYRRPATYGVVAESVDVPMRDGITIACSLRRPTVAEAPAEGSFPGLVVELTPYATLTPFYQDEADYFVARGYVALVCTLRGVGRSGGTWQHAMSSQDGRDAHDLVEWLATQPFCDGRVGQFGESYGGATSYGAAVERPPHLRAVAPLQPPSDLYRDVVYPGGIKSTERGSLDNWPPIAQPLSLGAVDAEAEYAINRAHPTYDAYWRDHTLLGRYAAIEVPVLTVGGWIDGYFRSGTLTDIEALPEQTWAIYGPWVHGFPITLCDCPPRGTFLPGGVLLAWFDHWVMELADVPIPAEPNFVSFEGPLEGGAGWREIRGWDADGRSGAVLYLGADGSLTPDSASAGTVTFQETGTSADPGTVAVFTSDPLAADQVLLGHPTLSLEASIDAADAHFYVELIDVPPGGSETVVNDGFLAASHRSSHSDPEPVEPGTSIEYEIPIRAQHYRFAAGHRVRIRIGAGDPSLLVPPEEPVQVTIHTGTASSVQLPGW